MAIRSTIQDKETTLYIFTYTLVLLERSSVFMCVSLCEEDLEAGSSLPLCKHG